MKQEFSKTWKKSRQPRKQRKYSFNLPLHARKKFLRAPLSKDLRKKYDVRNIGVRKGDKIKVLRGAFRGKNGKVERVDLKKGRIYVTGMEKTKKEGSKVIFPIVPSNIMIQELELKDARRIKQVKKSAGKKNETSS